MNVKEIISKYIRNWYWFLFSIFMVLCLAFLFLRYAVPLYQASATIQIVDEASSSSELGVFQDLGVFSQDAQSKVMDEIEVFKSRSNFVDVVKKLGLNISIEKIGNIKNSELYERPPYRISFIGKDSILDNANLHFIIEPYSETSFKYAADEDGPMKLYAYGKNIETPIGKIVVIPNLENAGHLEKGKYLVNITPVESIAAFYRSNIVVTPVNDYSNIVSITLVDPIQQKAIDVINALIEIYNHNGMEDRREVADRTSEFIDNRINKIYSELSSVDQSAVDYKSQRGLTDVETQTNLNLNLGASNQQELQNASIQLDMVSSMKDIVEGQNGYEILPSNIGISDETINGTTAKYNELVAERNRLLKSSNAKNPIIQNLDQQLGDLKKSMESSLNSATNNLNLRVNSLSEQMSRINSRIYSAPKNERALRDISRQQQTTESLYLYLLQKREEAQISFASKAPKSKVVDKAFRQGNGPVAPQKRIVYMGALILGLLIPFVSIYAHDLLDNKIHNKLEVEKLVNEEIPVVAEIPKLSAKENKLVTNNDRSILAESMRILRTNLDYIFKSGKLGDKGKIIFVTSSVSGEGKTLLSSNLSMVFSNTNKKVLLVGADVRNPKLHNFFDSMDGSQVEGVHRGGATGLTEYLYDDAVSLKEIINPIKLKGADIDVIFSGKIPPNPTELLMNERIGDLFKAVSEKYDYIIVDTAPCMVVTDTLLISQYADHTIYVVKAGFTETKVLEFPVKLKKEGKLKNLSFVVNNVKAPDLGYGGKYGYGYGKTVKQWWKFGA